MIELKAEITIELRSIKTGNIIYTEKAKPFDFNDVKELKKTLAGMFYNLNSMIMVDKMQEGDK